MVEAGDVPFRVGGTGGGMHLLLGNWAELSEGILGLDVSSAENAVKWSSLQIKGPRTKYSDIEDVK